MAERSGQVVKKSRSFRLFRVFRGKKRTHLKPLNTLNTRKLTHKSFCKRGAGRETFFVNCISCRGSSSCFPVVRCRVSRCLLLVTRHVIRSYVLKVPRSTLGITSKLKIQRFNDSILAESLKSPRCILLFCVFLCFLWQ